MWQTYGHTVRPSVKLVAIFVSVCPSIHPIRPNACVCVCVCMCVRACVRVCVCVCVTEERYLRF